MYQQRIEDKQNELEDARAIARAVRKAAVDAEGLEPVPGHDQRKVATELTRAEENVFWLAAELEALQELQAECAVMAARCLRL